MPRSEGIETDPGRTQFVYRILLEHMPRSEGIETCCVLFDLVADSFVGTHAPIRGD